jgi:rare lipoprotein A
MARAVLRDIVFGLATTGLLMGCVDGGAKSGTGDSAGLAAAPTKKKAGQEVEAPEVFQATDSALWDGRPSLGGIWVASPEVENPERVVMFNPATGKTVTGALFKRERENPGPRLQLSSDAAEALGILAGAPTEIRVTALRKEESPEEPVTEAAPADAAATDPAAQPPNEGDAAAIASAALAAVEGDKKATDPSAAPADPAAQDADPAAAAAVAAGAAAVAADGAEAVVDVAPKKKTWKERRAEAKAAREAKKKAAAEAKAAAAAAAAGAAVTPEGEAPTATPDSAAAAIAPIEAAPLDARSPEATAPVEPAKSKRKTVGDTAAAAPVEAEAPAPEAPAASGPARPIQVASFSKEDNAKRAAEALAKIGVTATPQKSEKAGKAVWGVVVMGDESMLKKIKDAGFADAYFLK